MDDSTYERRPSLRHLEAVSEDTQELLSPTDADADGSFVFDPITVSDDDTTDDEKPKSYRGEMEIMNDDNVVIEEKQIDKFRMELDTNYVSDDSDYEAEQKQQPHCSISLMRSHTPPNALLPTHARGRSEGQQHVMHIFHDELATLYEEPNKSSDSLDSSIKSDSSSSIVEHINNNTRVVRLRDSLDESNIRARWEYALRLMVGNCEPSELLYNTIVNMMPYAITNGEDMDMEMAEI